MEEKIQHTKDTNFFLSARIFGRIVLLATRSSMQKWVVKS